MRTKTAWIVLSFVVVFGLLISSTAGLADTPPPPPPNTPATGFIPPSPTITPVETTPGSNLPEAIDCAQAIAQGVEKQLNMRAAQIRVQCGLEKPGETTPESLEVSPATATDANAYGGTDVQVNNASADTYSHVTQSETFIAANANTVIVAYNSSTGAPGNYSGISYSTNGGNTFTEIRPSPFATGHGTNFGDPVALYNSKYGKWVTVWITAGGDCGTQGLGSWSSTNGTSWGASACVHVGTSDDRESGWVDNNPSSPYYGKMYVSWNDFSTTNGNLVVATSTNGGASWSAPVTIFSSSFMRDAQMTGGQDGSVFIVGMDEGGGGTNPRHNYIFRSVNGGTTWTSAISMGASFPAPGDIQCTSYFRAVTPIWRFMGYGQPAVGPGGVVHYVYTAGSGGADTGNTYYVRSTDNGSTWSTPLKLNTDSTTRTQWMPSLAVTVNGKVMASWYDRRNTVDNSYQRYARVSLDNGLTWQTDQPISDQVIPQPEQPDPSVNACYAGDYDYSSATGQTIYSTWTDGRIQISGHYQQDVYLDKVNFQANIPVCTAVGAYGWSAVAALPQRAYGPGVTADANFVYAAGGYAFGPGALDQFVRYSPAANTWTPLMPLPAPAYVTSAVYANGKVYVFGGQDASNTVVNNTRIYNIASNTWSAGAPMPDVRQQMGAGYYNGKIYLVGGYSGTNVDVAHTMNQTWVYNIASNSWSTLAPLPSALGGPASQVVGSHLYIIGGRDPNNIALNTVYDYSILANTWTTRSPMLSATNVAGSALYHGKIWVMGGGAPFLSTSQSVPDANQPQAVETTNFTQIYNPATDTWSLGPAQVYPRSFQGAATTQGVVVSVGGFNGDGSPVTEVPIQRPLRILIAYADPIAPGTLQNALLGQLGVSLVDLFNVGAATPNLALLKTYDQVTVFSNLPLFDGTALGNVLADYVDSGGVVTEFNFGFYDPDYRIKGRWESGGYTPFNNGASSNFSNGSLGTPLNQPNSPLFFGVNSLNGFYRLNVTLASGAAQVAQWNDALPFVALKNRAVGVNNYIGDYAPGWSGDFARLIINAGFSLRPNRNICSRLNFPVMERNH
jgi:N-acetylneuraminic acid mutarotase